jgi:hypothetical protein
VAADAYAKVRAIPVGGHVNISVTAAEHDLSERR